jgi:hypothetical protein
VITPEELRDLEDRPKRYWHVDGIPELIMGLVWILWGGALLLGDALPRRSGARAAYWLIAFGILVFSGWAIRRLKERLTYPRTGYIEYRDPGPRVRLLTRLIAMLSAAAIAGLIVTGRAAGMEHSGALVLGVILSLAFVGASVRQKAPHLLALAGIALALGVAFAALKLGWAAMNWLFVWLGVAASVMGAWRLRRYLRQHPTEAQV